MINCDIQRWSNLEDKDNCLHAQSREIFDLIWSNCNDETLMLASVTCFNTNPSWRYRTAIIILAYQDCVCGSLGTLITTTFKNILDFFCLTHTLYKLGVITVLWLIRATFLTKQAGACAHAIFNVNIAQCMRWLSWNIQPACMYRAYW